MRLVELPPFLFIIIGSTVMIILNALEVNEIKKTEVEGLLRKAGDLYKGNQLQNALRTFRKALNYDSGSYEALLGAAQCHRMLMQTEPAVEHYKKAISLDPKKFQAFFFLGLVYLQTNQQKDALDTLCKAEELKPDFEELNYLLGEIYEKRQDLENAYIHYEKYVKKCETCRLKEELEKRMGVIAAKMGKAGAGTNEETISMAYIENVDLSEDASDVLEIEDELEMDVKAGATEENLNA